MIDIIDYTDGSRNGYGKAYDVRLDKSNPLRDMFFHRSLTRDEAVEEFAKELCRDTNEQTVMSPFHATRHRVQRLYEKHGRLRLFYWGERMKEHAQMIRLYITINASEIHNA